MSQPAGETVLEISDSSVAAFMVNSSPEGGAQVADSSRTTASQWRALIVGGDNNDVGELQLSDNTI